MGGMGEGGWKGRGEDGREEGGGEKRVEREEGGEDGIDNKVFSIDFRECLTSAFGEKIKPSFSWVSCGINFSKTCEIAIHQ